ncbi:MAG: hypothetical protein ACE37J_19985 [Pikeienuella sp.]|uniref:hypothetical protein n=1 Tax=Pikeienuella sp. TaxID=2831957 RepID=UPI003919CA3C
MSLDVGETAPFEGAEAARRVRRRRVLYFHGFDPAPTERYRRLIARAGAERGGTPPAMSAVGPLSPVSEGWRITARGGAGPLETPVETVFEILRYEDVVRQWRARPLLARLGSGAAALARFAATGGLRRVFSFSKGPAGLLFYPVVILSAFLVAGAAAGGALGDLAGLGWGDAGAALGALLGLWASVRAERALFSHLMLGLFEFLFRLAADRPPSGRMEMREAEFAARIAESIAAAEADGVDEILIVGHSLGAVIAIRALAAAMRIDVDLSGGRARLSLLTLGSVGGYVSAAGGPGAEAYGEDMILVASDPDIFWLDVSSKRDWFSFGLVDPLLMLEAAPAAARSPKVISAKFGPARPDPEDRRTRFRAMSLHMKYLAAPDRQGAFDFLAAAAGGETLEARFRDRRDSPQARLRLL